MNIVILDGYALNPGDLSWDALKALGGCQIFDRTKPEDIVARAINADIILTNKVVLDKTVLVQLPNLKYVGVTATGYNVVDIAYAKERGIIVTNVPGYSTSSVAQAVFALLLELTNSVGVHNQQVHAGDWVKAKDFCFWTQPIIELAHLTLGIIGYGKIGRAVAKIGAAMGMKVSVYSRTVQNDALVTFMGLEQLLQQSDVVSLHCPLTEHTEAIINHSTLRLMKRSAYLINTSRGGLVNEGDLAEALNKGCIKGAGLDVLSTEPPAANNPLLTAKNCIKTPHIAWASVASRQRCLQIAMDNVIQFLQGNAVNVVH